MSQLRLLIAGDTNVQLRPTPVDAFAHVRPLLAAADVRIAHLEGLFGPTAQPQSADLPFKPLWRHAEPAMVSAYADAGFDLLCCASNVAYGRGHVVQTIRLLEHVGIACAGIGRNLAQAQRPAIVERRGVRVGLLSHTSVFWPEGIAASHTEPGAAVLRAHTAYEPGRRALEMPGAAPIVRSWPNAEDLAGFADRIRLLKREADIAIVSCHWGISSSHEPAEYQRTLAHAAIDAGADLVFGHHPHVLQACEVFRGRPIFYSLGNFAFDWAKMRGRALDGILLDIRAGKDGISEVAFRPSRRSADDNDVRICHPANDEHGRAIARQMQALSGETVRLEVDADRVVLHV